MKRRRTDSHRFCSLFLALLLIFSAIPVSAFAADSIEYADALHALGVFQGTGNGYELERTARRSEGVAMLVRLLGGESEAAGMSEEPIPFTDVPSWAHGYVAYAYENGLTNGTGATVFGSDQAMDARMFATLLLRCLGYSDKDGDFTYAKSIDYAAAIGLLDSALCQELQSSTFTRGHIARMSYEALRFPCKGADLLLVEKLAGEGKITQEQASNLIASVISPQTAAAASNLDVTEIAQNADSMVLLMCRTTGGYAQGSGIIIGSDGTIATNYHVIAGAVSIKVCFNNNTWYEGEVFIQDFSEDKDLAILKINKVGLTPVTLGDSDNTKLGESVIAIGSPMGLFNTVSEGIISSIQDGVFQTTAAISQGSSGGALFNRSGAVIGITYAGIVQGENLGFAIPVNILKTMTNQRMMTLSELTAATAPQPPSNLRIVEETDSSVYFQWDPVDGADYYYFYYRALGEENFWYETENGEKTRFVYTEGYSVRYFNLIPGKTYEVIVTTVRDGVESADSKMFTFVKGTGAGNGISCYADAWWLPDFGGLYGYSPTSHDTEYGMYVYKYDISTFDHCLSYYDLLYSMGYQYDENATAGLTSFHVPMLFYNTATGRTLVTDILEDTGEFALYTM
ncbi:hypothetical protein SDC9_81225 [bioreactor metagenome]|uniref:Uncharacterized protein n=1 Tax=bioreactor metagenome TaxID=1076179 RepID=A0A644Z2Y6_9ZZZZ